jgi:anti-sigma regulatory factor (Ser/Thr protein kinase)
MAGGFSEHPAVDLELPARPSSVTEARHAVTRLARAVGASEPEVALGVSEAVGNAVLHAFRDEEPGSIRVRATPERGALIVLVVDNGSGMAPNLGSRGLGFGIPLITQVARDVHFDSSEQGTSVSMSFDAVPLSSAESSQGGPG